MLVKTVALCSRVFYDKHSTKNGQDVVPSMSPLHKGIIMDICYTYYATIRNFTVSDPGFDLGWRELCKRGDDPLVF